jgi:hypothetical protein
MYKRTNYRKPECTALGNKWSAIFTGQRIKLFHNKYYYVVSSHIEQELPEQINLSLSGYLSR